MRISVPRIIVILIFLITGFFIASGVSAQLISIKTVPLATGDQFLLFPSENLGMGGVSIALDDALLDPFRNPAKGSRVDKSLFFTTPAYNSVSEDNGSTQTLPLGALLTSARWFGAASFALQRLERPHVRDDPWFNLVPESALSKSFSNNAYFFVMAGRRISGSPFSLAGSYFRANLGAVGGVEHLYASGSTVKQSGHMDDIRAGITGDLKGGRSVEILMLYNGFSMIHTVIPSGWLQWEDAPTRPVSSEKNIDHTNTYGIHIGYIHPISTTGWRLGGIMTVNSKSHPKIPNYVLMNIPRDPGVTWAFNYGLGISREWGKSLFGIDAIYEPIWSHTWAEAEVPIETVHGTIPIGGKTVDNHFRFSNTTLRMGLKRKTPRLEFQFGLEARHIRYRMDQYRYADVSPHGREQVESWWELTPAVGLAKDFGDFILRYTGRLTTGTGRPGIAWGGISPAAADETFDILLAPSGALALDGARVFTHQLSLAFAIGE